MYMELTIAVIVVIVLFSSFYGIALFLNVCYQPDWEDDTIMPDSPDSFTEDLSWITGITQWTAEDDARNLQEGRRSRVCRCGACLSTARKRGMRSE